MGKYPHIDTLVKRYPPLASIEDAITRAVEAVIAAYERGGKLLLCGNGGSSADADHIVGELMKGFCSPRPLAEDLHQRLIGVGAADLADKLQTPLRAINLGGHPALSSAFANDVDPNLVYAQQALGYTDAGDIFLGISTSGNTGNVYSAALVAKAQGATVIALTGKDGGRLRQIADICVIAPETETYKIQELHLPIYHCLCLQVEEHFFEQG